MRSVLNKIIASLIIFSLTSGACFSAESNNNLDNISTNTIINQTNSDEQGALSEFKDTVINIFSNALQKIKNFFSIDEKNIYSIIENLDDPRIKKALEEYENNNIKTSENVLDYYEKILIITLDSIKEYHDEVTISPEGNASNALKNCLIKTIIAIESSEQIDKNDKINKSVKNISSRIEHIGTLKDFRNVSKDILNVISEIKNTKKTENYNKLIYRYNKDIINTINKCSEYSLDVFDKDKMNKNCNGTWIENKKGENAGYIDYNEKENAIFVTFRGTHGYDDIKTDIEFPKQKCSFLNNKEVHGGFLKAYNFFKEKLKKELTELVKKHKDAKIIFTGHSLGGALATLSALDTATNNDFKDKNINLITFCSPRVLSNDAYKYSLINQNTKKLHEKTIRVWREGDLVSSMPFEGYSLNFKHFGKSLCIDKLPDNYEKLKTGIKSWFSYSEWVKWGENFKLLHGIIGIRNDIQKIYENNKEYIDSIKIYKD
ncbi:MAG: lipase family protein [Clostridia bacterium]|nr:lipase family protein [Clostridia bacterium]